MKKSLISISVLFTLIFTYTIIPQEDYSLKIDNQKSYPPKINKLLLDPLSAGTYTIGTGGHFPTIDSAFNKLSIDGIAGEVVLELIDSLYTAPTNEYGFFLNGPISGASPNSRILIKPATNKKVTIEGNGYSEFYLLNTSYLTIDGVNLSGTTTLTVHSITNNQFAFNFGAIFANNSDHNAIQNSTFICEDIYRGAEPILFYVFTPGISSAPDSNLIQNNFIKEAGVAILVSAEYSLVKATGNIIRGNLVGSETDSLISWGIQAQFTQNTIIENNIVQNIRRYYWKPNPGINSYCGNGDIIRNNLVHNIDVNNGVYGGIGILLSGDLGKTGNNNLVYNNIVYDIRSSTLQAGASVSGIRMWYQNNPKIYYNSVYLNGNGNGANPNGSAALYISNDVTNLEAKNNIFINTRDESPYCASSIYDYSVANVTTDYNDLCYQSNSINALVRIANTKYYTLLDWQATGNDLHSVTEMPNFISPKDLHINTYISTNLEKRGTPIDGLDTDFDADLRNVNLPDIGADEFAGMIPTGALSFGAYSVGTTGFFPSIESVFNRLSTDGVEGPVTLELTDNLYTAPTTQYGFSLNGPIPGAGPNSRVTIKPSANKNVIIEGSNEAIFNFNNTSYLTIDGVEDTGATTLTIHAVQNLSYTFNDALDFLNNSDHNVIQNVTLIVDDYLKPSSGIYFSGSAPDSNLIQYNFFKKGGMFISIISGGKGNIIRENKIGSGADSLVAYGIEVANCEGTLIENNLIQNMKVTLSGSNQAMIGIALDSGNNQIIRNNVIKNIRAVSGYITAGIYVGVGGTNNQVYNNMVYDINSTSIQSNNRLAGIYLAYQTNPIIYYNSVYLLGGGATPLGSAALYIYTSCTNIDAKNNIFINTRDESTYCASSIYDYSASNLITDYNGLFYQSNSNNALVRIGNTKYNTLTDWQTTGKDLHSVNEMPYFIAPYLHIKDTISYLESRGTPIAGVTLDFDGQPRHSTTPDIGADEFNGVVVGVEDEKPLPKEFALAQNYPNPFNPATTINYQLPVSGKVTLKVYDLLGNEIATLVNEGKAAGTYNLTWNATQLSSGVYFYRLQAGSLVQTRKMILLK